MTASLTSFTQSLLHIANPVQWSDLLEINRNKSRFVQFSRLGLVGLVWFGRFGNVGLFGLVWFGKFGLIGLILLVCFCIFCIFCISCLLCRFSQFCIFCIFTKISIARGYFLIIDKKNECVSLCVQAAWKTSKPSIMDRPLQKSRASLTVIFFS